MSTARCPRRHARPTPAPLAAFFPRRPPLLGLSPPSKMHSTETSAAALPMPVSSTKPPRSAPSADALTTALNPNPASGDRSSVNAAPPSRVHALSVMLRTSCFVSRGRLRKLFGSAWGSGSGEHRRGKVVRIAGREGPGRERRWKMRLCGAGRQSCLPKVEIVEPSLASSLW